MREAAITWKDVFIEVPIKVQNKSLAQALIADLDPSSGATEADLERLNLSSAPFLAKTMTNLTECIDDLLGEQQKVSCHSASVVNGGSCSYIFAGMATWV